MKRDCEQFGIDIEIWLVLIFLSTLLRLIQTKNRPPFGDALDELENEDGFNDDDDD